jgi:hypothetical protein
MTIEQNTIIDSLSHDYLSNDVFIKMALNQTTIDYKYVDKWMTRQNDCSEDACRQNYFRWKDCRKSRQ